MIATDVVREIRRMLAEGSLSQRAIAERMGVSRGTVCAIAQGTRGDYPPRFIRKDMRLIRPAGRPARCSGCGALVQMPCLACYIRQWQRRQTMARETWPD
jgi:transcriptional regulator with XRE-family HTH domain